MFIWSMTWGQQYNSAPIASDKVLKGPEQLNGIFGRNGGFDFMQK